MAQQRNLGYQFTTPYAPEQGDFQPVPINMQIAFVPVATGPPFSIGDDIEAVRRREMERIPPSLPTYQAPMIAPSPQQTTSDNTHNRLTDPYVTEPLRNQLLDTVMAIMRPTDEMLQYNNTFTNIEITNQVSAIPIAYIRETIPRFYRHLYLDEQSATHLLQLTSINQETMVMPAHDLVLVAQCLAIRNVSHFARIIPGFAKPVLVFVNVPHLQSFNILFRWLYSNDRDELYESLAASRADGPAMILGFAQNCKFWGAIDPWITRVIRAVLETES